MFITTPRDLGAAIRDRRKQLGLGQAELATRAGVSRQWLIQVEGGKPGVAIGLVLRLLNVLDLRLTLDAPGLRASPTRGPLEPSDPTAILDRLRQGASK